MELSAEQLQRMQDNKKRAQERLAHKKQQSESSVWTDKPPAPKRTAPALPIKRFNKEPKMKGTHPSRLSTNATAGHPTKWQRATKVTLTMVTRSKFKAVAPYDKKLIETFKKIASHSYDARSANWSFSLEGHNQLVSIIHQECSHVQLDPIPKPVLNCFLHQQSASSKKGASASKGKEGCCCTTTPPPAVEWNRISPEITSALMQFQRDGIEFCIYRRGRALLADDMGLGKTLQAIAVMEYYKADWPLLVVCPSSVRLTWEESFKRWIPTLKASEVNVVLSSRGFPIHSLIYIISYDLLVKLSAEVKEKHFNAVIADESHFLKNYRTARCLAALPVLKEASRVLLLSGTPALSRPLELYTQITALDKQFRLPFASYGVRYCDGVKNRFGWDFSGASNMQELQLYLEERLMIRRLKVDVLDQLPPKRRQVVVLNPALTKGRSAEHKVMREGLKMAGSLKALDRRSALMPLFSKSGLLKLPAINDYIVDLMEGGRKVIVFAHHKAVMDGICDCLRSKKHQFVRIDGHCTAEERQGSCDRFQFDDKYLVAVLSITAAGTGITLTAASVVVFAELFWNPGILVQAEDRAYRIGQKNSVNIHYLVAKETVDDFIWPLVRSKLQVLNQAGLSTEDFFKADSKIMEEKDPQSDLLQYFDVCKQPTGSATHVSSSDDEAVVMAPCDSSHSHSECSSSTGTSTGTRQPSKTLRHLHCGQPELPRSSSRIDPNSSEYEFPESDLRDLDLLMGLGRDELEDYF